MFLPLKVWSGTSLVAQWLRIRLPMQGTQGRTPVWGDPTCHGTTKLMCHNYWACALEPMSHSCWAPVPQLLKPACLEPMLCNKRSHHNEKPAHCNKDLMQPKINTFIKKKKRKCDQISQNVCGRAHTTALCEGRYHKCCINVLEAVRDYWVHLFWGKGLENPLNNSPIVTVLSERNY